MNGTKDILKLHLMYPSFTLHRVFQIPQKCLDGVPKLIKRLHEVIAMAQLLGSCMKIRAPDGLLAAKAQNYDKEEADNSGPAAAHAPDAGHI
eukprot:1322799-Amphidinium_carterae.2